MWFLFHRIRWNKSSYVSTVSSAQSAAVRMSERHSPERTPRRMTASTRCRSVAVAKPHCVRQLFGDDNTLKNCPCRLLAYAMGMQGSNCVNRLRTRADAVLYVGTDRRFIWYSNSKNFQCCDTCDTGKQRWRSELSLSLGGEDDFHRLTARGVARNLFWGGIKFQYSLCFTIRNTCWRHCYSIKSLLGLILGGYIYRYTPRRYAPAYCKAYSTYNV